MSTQPLSRRKIAPSSKIAAVCETDFHASDDAFNCIYDGRICVWDNYNGLYVRISLSNYCDSLDLEDINLENVQ